LEQARVVTSWDLVQAEVLDSGEASIPYEIALLKPAVEHLRQFAKIFESQLGLPAEFVWGIIALLIKARLRHPTEFQKANTPQLTAQHPQALSRIPRMLKSLGYKAEDFKGYYAVSQEDLPSTKEPCFDIQVQLVRFFTSAVRSIRGGEEEEWGDGALYGKLRPIKA
jgi:hypothetical protein